LTPRDTEIWSTTTDGESSLLVPRPHADPDLCSWEPIIKYIKDQHSGYLRKELTAMRDKYIVDTRIHCCLYFIAPTGHSLKAIDITVMKKLSEVVNVVPIIAKSDSLTLEERELFKQRVGLVTRLYSSQTTHERDRSAPSCSTTTSVPTPLTTKRTTRRRPS
jgi:hypothetical protein